jgi:Protein of unknown function (DUF2934)
MAKSKRRDNGDPAAPEATSAVEGREAIHGNNEPYGDRVAQRAYELYLARGGADGRDFDDWLIAERELTSDRKDDHHD